MGFQIKMRRGVMSMRRLKLLTLGILVSAGLVALPTAAGAAPLQGQLAIGIVPTGGVTITMDTIDWFPPNGGPDGGMVVGNSSTLDFAFLSGDTGHILDLNDAVQPAGPGGFPAGAPNATLPGEGVVFQNFLTFDTVSSLTSVSFPGADDVFFDLSRIDLSPFSSSTCGTPPAPAGGQVCGLGPFSFINLTDNVSTVSMSVAGFVRNNLGELSTFAGGFSAQFNEPFQDVIAALEAPGGSVTNTFSGTFTATVTPVVPEPVTLVTFGSGLVFLVSRARNRRRKA